MTASPASPHPTPHRRTGLYGVLLLAILMRSVVFVQAVTRDPTFGKWLPTQDMYAFDAWAQAMTRGDWAFDPRPERPYAPAYSVLLAAIYKVAGPDMRPVAVVQMLWGILTVYALYGLGRALFDCRVGLVAALGYALYLPACYYETRLLRVAWVNVALILGAWWLVRALQSGRGRWFLAVGGALGTATALRVSNLLLPLAAGIATFRQERRIGKRGGKATGFLLVGLAVAWGPWFVWDAVRPRLQEPTQSSAKINFVAGNTPDATGVFFHVPPTANRILAETHWETGPLLRELIVTVRSEPGRWLGVQLRKALAFWHGYEPTNNVRMTISARFMPVLKLPVLRFWPVGLLGLAGLAATWRRSVETRAVAALVLAVYASIAPFLLLSRYRLAVVPLLLPFAAWAVVHGWPRLRRRPAWAQASILGVLGLALAATHPRTFRLWFRPGFVEHFEGQAALNLAVTYAQDGRVDEALREYARIYAQAPAFTTAFQEYVFLLHQAGRTTEARSVCADARARRLLTADDLRICDMVDGDGS